MPRTDPDLGADPLTMLSQFLDYHRNTLLMKIDGLSAEQLSARLPSSELTLAGIVKHVALCEDSWFHERMAGNPLPEPWASAPFDEDADWEFHSAPDDSPEELTALYLAACDRSRAVVASIGDLAARSASADRNGIDHFTLGWILLHMVEETARHNGHADLLRESIDGVTGE